MNRKSDNLSGVLVVDKPAGPTSHDVVSMVKRIARAEKAGHLGTLDPQASGVLPIAINGATKLAKELAGDEKVYEFTLRFGVTTDTDDEAGRVMATGEASPGMMADLEGLLPRFTGTVMQSPPRFSAVRVGGRRAYDLARRGRDFELKPRPVSIDSIDVLGGDWPDVRFRMACRSGTYVRSLCRDIGAALGCGGHARGIRRLRSGPYIIDMAVGLGELRENPHIWQERIISLK